MVVRDEIELALAAADEPVTLSKATGVRVGSRNQWDAYAKMVEYVREHTAHDEPIFSGAKRTDRLFANDALLYFIANRPSATRWIEMEPGLTNTVRGQLGLINELETKGVRVIVLWNNASSEPNATGASNSIELLDRFIEARFQQAKSFGDYAVLVRRAS